MTNPWSRVHQEVSSKDFAARTVIRHLRKVGVRQKSWHCRQGLTSSGTCVVQTSEVAEDLF